MSAIADAIRPMFEEVEAFSAALPRRKLRRYQVPPMQEVAEAVERRESEQYAVIWARQSGKDESLAQLVAFLLNRYQREGGTVVMVTPTLTPQGRISMRRARERLLEHPLIARAPYSVSGQDDHQVILGKARAVYLSAEGAARGNTADLLLIANEAQDIAPADWQAVFEPMTASTAAPIVYSGTSWTGSTLLAQKRRALPPERVFVVDGERVAEEVPAYGRHLARVIAEKGRGHPLVRCEYFCEELDGEGGLFPPRRRELLQGAHERVARPLHDATHVLLVDVAGEDEAGTGPEAFDSLGKRDSTAVTVVEVEPAGVNGRVLPRYLVRDRIAWTGMRHTAVHDRLTGLVDRWGARAVIVDATGVGAGLYSWLSATYGRSRVIVHPVVFSSAVKSRLGWTLTGLIDADRLKDYARVTGHAESEEFWRQVERCEFELPTGRAASTSKLMRWGVPASRGHDDLVLSLALVGELETGEIDLRSRRAKSSSPAG